MILSKDLEVNKDLPIFNQCVAILVDYWIIYSTVEDALGSEMNQTQKNFVIREML